MAAGSSNHVHAVQFSFGKPNDKKEVIACGCSEIMQLELNSVKLELSSLREIIRVLQEEISQSSQPAENNGNEVYEGEESYTLSTCQEWTTLPSNRRQKLPRTNSNFRQLPLATFNKFATLANLKNENQFSECVPHENYHKKRRSPLLNASKIKQMSQQIVIVGDSHARKSAAELKHCLDPTFEISSFVKPGAGMKDIIDSAREDIKKFKHDDVAVIWGGSNDIGKNNSKGALKHLCDFVKNNQKVKTIVMTAPPRYDLLPTSCVNNEVTNFNRQLRKRTAPYKNVKVLETGLKREYFTKHGLHLNLPGKECIAQELARAVRSFFKEEKMSPISLHWKDDTSLSDLNGNEPHTPKCNAVAPPQSHFPISPKKPPRKESKDPTASPYKENEDEVTNDYPQLTKRQRNRPAPRNQDFLWIT